MFVSFRWKPSRTIPEDVALLQLDFKTDSNGKYQPEKDDMPASRGKRMLSHIVLITEHFAFWVQNNAI